MALARPLLGQRRSAFLAILAVALYTLLMGASALVVRAAIMSSLAPIAGRLAQGPQAASSLSSVGNGNSEVARRRTCWRG